MAFNCCSNCLPLLLEYHSASLDLERKLQNQVFSNQKIELSKLQFEKQIRDLASLSYSQITAPETPNSKRNCQSTSDKSLSITVKSSSELPIEPVSQTPAFESNHLELFSENEISLKNSLNELKSSLNSLISSAEFFTNSMSTLKQSSD